VIAFALETLDLGRILREMTNNKTNPSNTQSNMLLAVAGVKPSDADLEKELASLYENPTDDLEQKIEEVCS
jgi:hypothetical protein